MSDNTAILAGYTWEVTANNSAYDLHLFVKPGTDLDGTFRAYDADNCEFIDVNGWLFSIEDVREAS